MNDPSFGIGLSEVFVKVYLIAQQHGLDGVG